MNEASQKRDISVQQLCSCCAVFCRRKGESETAIRLLSSVILLMDPATKGSQNESALRKKKPRQAPFMLSSAFFAFSLSAVIIFAVGIDRKRKAWQAVHGLLCSSFFICPARRESNISGANVRCFVTISPLKNRKISWQHSLAVFGSLNRW